MKFLLGLLDVWDLVEKDFEEKILKEEVELDKKKSKSLKSIEKMGGGTFHNLSSN